MLRKKLRLLIVGFDREESARLQLELSDSIFDLTSACAEHVLDIKSSLYGSEWDVVVCNHSLPSINAQQALNLLLESGRDIPFIVYSDDTDETFTVSIIQNGASDYLKKENISRLVLSIDRELKNSAVRRAKTQAESHIYRLAYYDELTGLPKRRLFCEKVIEILSERTDSALDAAIYFIELDRMPRINSTYGYNVGDILIQQLSYRLSVYAGRHCLLTRVEGGKFAFFNSEVKNAADIQAFADKILRLIATPFVVNNLEFFITINIGICVYPEDGEDISILLANAESAISHQRGLWRNNCKYYEKTIGEANAKRLKLERSLRKSIENDELLLQYQPIIDLKTGAMTGAEALVRWNHPELGIISPDNFIPLADETGFIVEIGKWVLKQACIQAKQWHDAGYDAMFISLNVSAIELDQAQLLEHVANVLEETELRPDALVLEITESVLMQDAEASIKILRELKEMGVKIAVDDFGTGYSSLSYLQRFPIDILKIDRSFAIDTASDKDSSAIVSAIITLAKNLDLSVLAEGIETKEQFEFLCDGQCDRAQGFLFSKPVDAGDILLQLEQRVTGMLAS